MKIVALLALVVLASMPIIGCTSVRVQPVDGSLGIKLVCIEFNDRVRVDDFVSVVRDGFDRHGISTKVFTGKPLEGCEYTLTYTARRGWDFAPYLSDAELRLDRKGEKVGFAEYHLMGKGGLSMMKWQGTKTKMTPVIDELLEQYQVPKDMAQGKSKSEVINDDK